MQLFIKKGLNFNSICGSLGEVKLVPKPKNVGYRPCEYKGIIPNLLVKLGQQIRGGQPLFCDVNDSTKNVVSSVPGIITQIESTANGIVSKIIINPDWDDNYITHERMTLKRVDTLNYGEALGYLKKTGLFPYFRQRPFDKIPNPNKKPKAIFINGMDTNPCALNPMPTVKQQQEEFVLGATMVTKLTNGAVHLCIDSNEDDHYLQTIDGVTTHTISGPHPSGLVGTHMHMLSPLQKGETNWYISALDCVAIGSTMKQGLYARDAYINLAQTVTERQALFRTVIGAQIESLISESYQIKEQRIIDGTMLFGKSCRIDDFLGLYTRNIQIIPEKRNKKLFGWANIMQNLLKPSLQNIDTDKHGATRAMLDPNIYDQVVPLDISIPFILKAIEQQNCKELESLGLLDLGEEDFALATFACPSKIDICSRVREGLNLLESNVEY